MSEPVAGTDQEDPPGPGPSPVEQASVAAPEPEPRATVADGAERLLDPRHLSLQRQVGWILAACCVACVMIGVPIVVLATELPTIVDALVVTAGVLWAVGFTWLTRSWPDLEHRHASYRVGPEGIEIRRGVLWRHVISVPRSRIQHTDVSQGPVERRYGLGTLTLFTAGTEHEKVELAGLDHSLALEIRDALAPSGQGDAV